MRYLIFISAIFLGSVSPPLTDDRPKSSNTGNSSYIDVTVTSNIDRELFSYLLNQNCLSPTPAPESNDTSVLKISVPVKEFKCINRIAYNDFLDLLNADHFPYLEINIPMNSVIKDKTDNLTLLKDVLITVAGVSKKYNIYCKTDGSNDDYQILKGTTSLKLTDLHISPPVKLFGLIRVKNEINIDFEFCLCSTNKQNSVL